MGIPHPDAVESEFFRELAELDGFMGRTADDGRKALPGGPWA